MNRTRSVLALSLILASAGTASAQGIVMDARLMGMGGGGGNSPNIARKMVPAATRAEIVIPIPLGLIQTFKGGFDKFKPSSTGFDPLLAVETTGSALHYRFGADTGSTRTEFVNDLVNGTVNPDLTVYSGFNIQESYASEGLFAPQVGKTIKFVKSDDRFHGVYVGIGPYLSYRTDADVDPRLANLLGDGVRSPNASMLIKDASGAQVAGALTVGYRGRMPMGSSSGDRDGVYLAYNFHYLKGFKYYQPDLAVRFNTDGAGNLSASATPFSLVSLEGKSGSGFANDIGIQFVRGNVQVGVGVNGIGNRINWSEFTQNTYTLPSLTAGFDFAKSPGTAPFQELRVTLPVVKTANVGYEGHGWGATATATDGYNGTSFSGGLERQVGPVWLRGGGRHSRDHWNPTVGFGIGTDKALDVALFSTHANFQDERQWALAASVRIGMK
ncbi:MAG TPA: hypothetical protein VMZ90_11925 [Vicinamibacterales bacterium]|nr:hypothetical protein [Vicinamibacterales bacterium]